MSVTDNVTSRAPGKIVVERVTPAKAAELLGGAAVNRNINRQFVQKYKDAMISGRWVSGLEPIHIDEKGALINGRHRLTAILESGIEQDMLVISGLPTSAMSFIDTGRSRSLGDTMQINGVKNANALASVVAMAWAVDTFGVSSSQLANTPPNDIGQALFMADQDAFEAAVAFTSKRTLGFLTGKIVGWLAYVTNCQSCEWTESVVLGKGLRERTGAYALHIRIIAEMNRKGQLKLLAALPLVIKAYIADLNKRPVGNLRYSQDEEFPAFTTWVAPRLGRNVWVPPSAKAKSK